MRVACREENLLPRVYTGEDCVDWFLRELRVVEGYLLTILFDDARLSMWPRDMLRFKFAKKCYLCHKEFIDDKDKVRDHDHISGAY